jgi:hypothetical protein
MGLRERPRLQEPVHYPDQPVRFSVAHLDTKQYCITKLGRQELAPLYRRLGDLENLTWGQFRGLPRKNGFSLDKRDSQVHALLANRVVGLSTFGHFRVTGTTVNMRVFVGLDRDLARLILIDRTGSLQH